MTRRLSGIRIPNLSRILAGQICKQLLDDYRAEVIKIEKPFATDDTRTFRGYGWTGLQHSLTLSA